jgi:hypothetical protein
MITKKQIKEATGSGSSGKFKVPIVLAPQQWKEDQLGPFIEPVYHYTNAELAYEEADGDFKESPEKRAEIERKTKKLSKIDDYLSTLGSGDVIAAKGTVGKAVESVQNARKDWRNLSRASILEDALNTAEAKALDPKASQGELIRRQLINLAADKDKMKSFSTREQNAIKSVASGGATDPLLSLLARFNPQRSQITAGALGAGALANPVAAALTAATGFGADKLQGLLRRQQTEGLVSNLLSGNMPESIPSSTFRGLLSSVPEQQQ